MSHDGLLRPFLVCGMTSDPNNPPTLSYATPDADGLPAWVPEAEELIQNGARPAKIRKFFRKSDHALRYYIKSVSRRFGPETLGDLCICCNAQTRDVAVQVEWKVLIPAKFLEFRINDSGPTGTMLTMHPICFGCLASLYKRAGYLWRTRVVLYWLGLFGWLSFIGMFILSKTLFRNSYWNWRLVLWLLGAYVLLMITSSVIRVLYARKQSRLLRSVMPRGVSYQRVAGLVERKDGQVMVTPM